MPETTPNLGLKKPLGNERVSREANNENWDIIDEGFGTLSNQITNRTTKQYVDQEVAKAKTYQ